MPANDAFSHLSARFRSQDLYLASQNRPKIYQKFIRRRVRAVLTQQIFSSPKAFPAGHIGNMSKGKDEGIGQICTSKPTWLDSRSANRAKLEKDFPSHVHWHHLPHTRGRQTKKIDTSSGSRKPTATVWHSYGCLRTEHIITHDRQICK